MENILKVTCHTDYVGPGSTFVAIKGVHMNGIDYIPLALEKGATKIVVDQDVDYEDAIRVSSARKALAELSAQAYGYPANNLKIVGITGTKGKTTTAFLAEHILKVSGHKTALISTVVNRIGDTTYATQLTTPQPDYLHAFFDQCRKEEVEYVIMEVAAQALTLHRVDTILFDRIVFTNFSQEHGEFYTIQAEYFRAKCQLFNHLKGKAIINIDDKMLQGFGEAITISMVAGDFVGSITASSLDGLTMKVNDQVIVAPSLIGSFSGYNVLAATAVAKSYGIPLHSIARACATFGRVPGRLERYALPNQSVAFIDTAHTPASFEALLSTLRPLSPHLIVVFGAGGDRDKVKRPLMGAIAERYADQVILTDDNPRSEDLVAIINDICAGMNGSRVVKRLDREEAIRYAYACTRSGSIVALLGKGPVEYQHIGDRKIPFSESKILRSIIGETI